MPTNFSIVDKQFSEMIPTDARIVIQKGISLPPVKFPKRGSKYPFGRMAVGDSFFASRSVLGSLGRAPKETGYKFTVRKEADGYRIWRIA